MKKFFFIFILMIMLFPMTGQAAVIDNTRGYILLQVEENGEAWYVNPADDSRYYMKDGAVAYQMMRNFGLGITDTDLINIPSVSDTTEMLNSSGVCTINSLAKRLKGKILLQVQQHGEAWYIYPKTCRRIYMKDGAAAYSIMRFLGLGITNQNLNLVKLGAQFDVPETSTNTNTTYSPVTSCPSDQLFYEPYNRCITYNESCNIKYQNSYLGEKNADGTYVCYCNDGYDWAYPLDTSGNYCKKNENLDSDGDGLFDVNDIHPYGVGKITTKVYYPSDYMHGYTYKLEFGIQQDYDYFYEYIAPHVFNRDFSNLSNFVTYDDPTIKEITDIFMATYKNDPELCVICLALDFVQNFDYIDDYKTGYDEYPKYPTETLMDGTGDCEDTSFLMAAIFKAMGADVVLLEFSNHVAVGVEMPSDFDGVYYTYDGKNYYFLETTGAFEIGDVPADLIGKAAIIHPIE